MQFFSSSPKSVLPGSIDPITAKIRGGVVRYDRFAVKIDKYELQYQGKINLPARTVDLQTTIPLAGLAMTFDELSGYADKISVPIVTRGSFGALKTEVDPSFDLGGALFDAGFRGGLNELLKKEGIPVGDLLGDLFNQRKRGDDGG